MVVCSRAGATAVPISPQVKGIALVARLPMRPSADSGVLFGVAFPRIRRV
jgi:hypothetical protein